jgi:hypothetical protein
MIAKEFESYTGTLDAGQATAVTTGPDTATVRALQWVKRNIPHRDSTGVDVADV